MMINHYKDPYKNQAGFNGIQVGFVNVELRWFTVHWAPEIPFYSEFGGSRLGGWVPRTDGYVVNNHGDRFRPLRIGLWDPLPNGLNG